MLRPVMRTRILFAGIVLSILTLLRCVTSPPRAEVQEPRKPVLAAGLTGTPCYVDAGADAEAGVVDGSLMCNGVCTNVTSNAYNCGSCGYLCPCGTSWNYCKQCVAGSCCILVNNTCQYAPAGTCCAGLTCKPGRDGTNYCLP
jgi:hypothetical protein